MKKTLLEIVQEILDEANGDNVSSISDTDESVKVASIVRAVYQTMIANREIPEHKELIQLTPLSDITRPTMFRLTEDIRTVDWIRYNGTEVCFIEPEKFLERSLQLNPTDTDVTSVQNVNNNVTLYVTNHADPTYFSSFDDEHIIMDSYDSAVDTTLQQSKTIAWGSVYPVFRLENDFVPDIDANLFPMFVEEAKSRAIYSVSGKTLNQKVETAARHARNRAQTDRHKVGQGHNRPRYGRNDGH